MRRAWELGLGERGWADASRVYLDAEGYLWMHAQARVLDEHEREHSWGASGRIVDLADVLVERTPSGGLVVDGVSFRRFSRAEGPGGVPADALPAEFRAPEE